MAESSSFTPVVIYHTETPDAVPSAVNLEVGELALNISDAKLFSKLTDNTIVELGGSNNHEHVSSHITDIEVTVNALLESSLRPAIRSFSVTSHTLSATDENAVLIFNNAGTTTVTVPSNANVSLPIGFICHIHRRGGSLSFAAAGGVQITTAETLEARKLHSSVSIVKVNTNDWIAFGDTKGA